MTTQDCNICCEKYNKTIHSKVTCEYGDCNFDACKSCVRTYLIGTTANPHCMNCKKPWGEKFLQENLNKTFYDKDYKPRRKELLVEREISRLPETMPFAERHKEIALEEEKSKVVYDKIKKLNKEVALLKDERYAINTRIIHIKNGLDPNGEVKERNKFIMACPRDCRGFLSSQYKCSICEQFTCPHCLEVIGESKTIEHTCNPDNVASAESIKKETKPCPNCGIRIFKISGCSQMWCTECKVAFNYNTGKIDTGVVHNPHYYAHMARINNGEAIRNPHDVLCGGLIHNTQVFNLLAIVKKGIQDPDTYNTLYHTINNMHRTISHITYNDLPPLRAAVRELQDSRDLRIRYILGMIDKKEMGTQLYRRDMKHKKQTELLHLYELISVVGIETFASMQNNFATLNTNRNKLTSDMILQVTDDVMKKYHIMNNMRKYINIEFKKISITYSHQVVQIDKIWNFKYIKFSKKDLVVSSSGAGSSTDPL